MAKDDFRRDENTYFGIPIETTEQLDEIRKALKSIEPLVSKLRDDFRAEKGNEQSRSDSLKDGLSKVFFGIKDVEDLLREGKAVDEKTVLKLFKTPIQDIFKDVSASQLILEKKGKERGFEFTERDLETLMMKSVKLASTVLTRVPKFGGQRPSDFKQTLNKTIEAQNELVFKKRMDAIQAEQDRIKELNKQDAKNRIAEEDLKRAEKAKVDADKKQRRLENKKSSVGVVSDEEKSALKSNREKYIKRLADYDEKLATFNKTQSELEKNLKTANRVVKEAMETDRIFSQDLRPIGDFGHILQRMFKRYIKYEEREEIQQETDLGKTILFKLVEAITAQYGFLPAPMDLASKDLYFNKEKDIKLINSLGEVLESAKEIMKSPIHPGRRPVNPHIRRGWADDKLSRKDQALLKVFNSENRKQAVEEYEQELDKEYRGGKESQIDEEEVVEAIEDLVEAVVEVKEAIADLSESNKSVSEVVVKTTTNQIKSNEKFVRTVIYGPSYVPPPHRAYTSTKPATAPQGTTSTAPQGTTSAPGLRPTLSNLSLLPPMPGPAQPSTPAPGIWDRVKTGITDGYDRFKQDSAKAKRDRYIRWYISQNKKGKSVVGGPSDLTRFGMWAGDQVKRGASVAESVGSTAHNIANTASGGTLDDKLIQSNSLSTVLKAWSEDRNANGKSGGLLMEDMALGIGAIVVILKKLSESSPILKAVLELFNLGMTLFIMPFGNMLGEWLLPLMMDFVGLMVNWNIFMSDLPAKLGEWFAQIPERIKNWWDGVKAWFVGLRSMFIDWIVGGLLWLWDKLNFALSVYKKIFLDLPVVIALKIWDYMKQIPTMIANVIKGALGMGEGGVIDTVTGTIGNAVSSVKGFLGLGEGGALEGVGNTVGNVVGAITGFLGFAAAAEGGYVPARPGGTPIIVGEGGKGEYIVPEGSAIKAAIGNFGGGTDGASVTVNISGNVYGVDDLERTIKRAVDDSINKSRFR